MSFFRAVAIQHNRTDYFFCVLSAINNGDGIWTAVMVECVARALDMRDEDSLEVTDTFCASTVRSFEGRERR